ncbi:MAG: hypothetical protein JG777_153 [Clostridia bacterium]|nr:hypothetical protein [Clostridia bacterium]
MEEQTVKLTRSQLYNEIWEFSVAGVAKKYNVRYADLLVNCKEWDIPVPPSGYWTKLSYGKPVSQIPLPESSITEIVLSSATTPKRSKLPKKVINQMKQVESKSEELVKLEQSEKQPLEDITPTIKDEQPTYEIIYGQYNTYDRQKLYEEVWSKPVVQVAIQYGVSDVAIHKICKSLQVPVPPRGYWAKFKAGIKMPKPPLPSAKGITRKTGSRTFTGIKKAEEPPEVLAFLDETDRDRVLMAAQEIQMPAENATPHKKIAAYKSVIKEWNKKDKKPQGAQRDIKNFYDRPPFLAGVVSNESLPRVFRILDALYRQVERLGGTVNNNLSLEIRGETVHMEISEAQDVVDHVLTKEEAQALLVYKDAKRRNSWASEPQIRKHDYIFNGRIRICIREHRYFRDSEKSNNESRIGELLIELYEQSEVIKQKRLAAQEAERKRKEEERHREERRIRYNDEVEKTIALMNIAQDYDMAYKIRAYIAALESSEDVNEKTAAFIDWAKKKADWFDPSVARTDEILGDRDHEESEERKSLKRRYY